MKIAAAQRRVTRNPTVVHFSQKLLHVCRHPSSAYYLVVPQLPCAETGLFQTDIREDAYCHKVTECKNLSSSLRTAVDQASQMDPDL